VVAAGTEPRALALGAVLSAPTNALGASPLVAPFSESIASDEVRGLA
jgi:hypothetical protein